MIISSKETKLRRINGDVLACQGYREDTIVEFESWYEAGCASEKPPLDDEGFAALVLTSDGRIFRYYDRCVPIELDVEFTALGAGDEIAMGAMAAGASPTKAVEIACELNAFTGGDVISLGV